MRLESGDLDVGAARRMLDHPTTSVRSTLHVMSRYPNIIFWCFQLRGCASSRPQQFGKLNTIYIMPPPRRKLQATVEETLTPPSALSDGQHIARIQSAAGNNLYNVELPNGKALLVELEARFRSTIWLKRGGFILVDTKTLAGRENKIDGEIVNVVRDEKAWRKAPFWPKEFVKKSTIATDSDEEESTVGKMPPSDSEDDG